MQEPFDNLAMTLVVIYDSGAVGRPGGYDGGAVGCAGLWMRFDGG